ncbi:ABC transporter substrate-binding protein, partial [Rubrobacter taiwanensis]
RDGVILINSNAAANELSWEQKSDYAYRVSQSNYQTGAAGAEYVVENVGRRAFTIGMDYVAGYEVIEGFTLAYEEAGGEVVGEVFSAPGTTDFATYLNDMRRAEPEVVFAFLSGTDAIRFIQQYDSFGLKGQIPLVGTDQLGSSLVTDAAGRSAEDIITRSPYYPTIDNETNRRFVEEFQSRHDRLPDLIDCQGYDSGQVIARAVEEAGSAEPEALIEVLRGISIESPRGPITIDPETNNPIQNYYIGENVWDGERIEVEVIETIEEVAMPPSPPN